MNETPSYEDKVASAIRDYLNANQPEITSEGVTYKVKSYKQLTDLNLHGIDEADLYSSKGFCCRIFKNCLYF